MTHKVTGREAFFETYRDLTEPYIGNRAVVAYLAALQESEQSRAAPPPSTAITSAPEIIDPSLAEDRTIREQARVARLAIAHQTTATH